MRRARERERKGGRKKRHEMITGFAVLPLVVVVVADPTPDDLQSAGSGHSFDPNVEIAD